jgi:8-oxo-dGTP pyrophosphatase MutT (NUDIX family)
MKFKDGYPDIQPHGFGMSFEISIAMDTGPVGNLHIAAALIDDDEGRLLLVRKTGTPWFMQAGGKIEPGETAITALARELREEIGLALNLEGARYLGRFSAPAANEADHLVEAEIFHIRLSHNPAPAAEIAEAVWVDQAQAKAMPLAPLTREHILPLALTLKPGR